MCLAYLKSLTSRDDVWSLERLVDETFYNLAFYDHYFKKAELLIYKIPVARARAPFIIKLPDLAPRIRAELWMCTTSGRRYVLRQAVAKVFETIDYNYTQLSVKPFLTVRVEP